MDSIAFGERYCLLYCLFSNSFAAVCRLCDKNPEFHSLNVLAFQPDASNAMFILLYIHPF